MPETPAIAVIVLNHGRAQDTMACAKSVLEQRPFLLVLVDNASSDDSVRVLADFCASNGPFEQFTAANADEARARASSLAEKPRTLFVVSPHNRGYAAGNNLGLAAALALGADACWVLNNDTLLEPGALQNMQKALLERAGEGLGLFGTTVLCGHDGLVQCLGGGHTNHWSGLSSQAGNGLTKEEAAKIPRQEIESRLNYICGASVVATRDFLEKTGLMDESFFLYCEEQDWAIRGGKNGFGLGFVPDAAIIHFEGSTTGMRPGSRPPARMARLALSRLRLAAKHSPITMPTVAAGLLVGFARIWWRRFFGQILPSGCRH